MNKDNSPFRLSQTALLFLLLLPLSLGAQQQVTPLEPSGISGEDAQIREEFLQWEDPVFGGAGSGAAGRASETVAQLEAALAGLGQGSSRQNLVRRSALAFLKALVELNRLDDEAAARASLTVARQAAETLTRQYPDAVAYRLLADASAQEMLLYPPWEIVTRAPRVEALARQALELDSTEQGARMLIAYGRVNAPRLFGGNPREARELFEQVLASPNLLRSQRFAALSGLALALEKLDQDSAAEARRQEARELFPEHWEWDAE